MAYIWDETKRSANIAKHGIDFTDADRFERDWADIKIDDRFDYGEVRQIAYGYIGQRLHVMVFTQRPPHIQVISLRKANRRERRDHG